MITTFTTSDFAATIETPTLQKILALNSDDHMSLPTLLQDLTIDERNFENGYFKSFNLVNLYENIFFYCLKTRFIVTRRFRNGLQIDHEGYSYSKGSEVDEKIVFRCKKRNECRGIATANPLLTRFAPIQQHNHLPSNDDLIIAQE